MRSRRIVSLFALLALLLFCIMLRVLMAAENPRYKGKAQEQIRTTLSLPAERGNIFDRNGVTLTKNRAVKYALCVPAEKDYHLLYDRVPYQVQETLYAKRNSTSPFLVPLNANASIKGLFSCTAQERSGMIPAAEHLIGYTGKDGKGIAGLEAAYDDLLAKSGVTNQIQCVTTGNGRLVQGLAPVAIRQKGTAYGLQTTLDVGIQRICEAAAMNSMDSGAIVVLETGTAEVLASVSVPQYDPENIAADLTREDSPFVDRTISQFCVGSVFKPVLAAAALESGLGWYSMECRGYIEVDGQIYRCAKSIAHGTVNIRKGLEESCNCFFISLGKVLGSDAVLKMANDFGYGKETTIAKNWQTAAGNLPKAKELTNTGQFANFCFGQGLLMATPLQIAAMIQAIANDGIYIEPSYIRGIVDGKGTLVDIPERNNSVRVISAKTAALLQDMLATVVSDGIGREAAAEKGSAAGKTGTAQTGRRGNDGEERMDCWFAGFYPAEDPQYTIVVLQDNTVEPKVSCAAVFSRICDQIAILKNVDIE